MPCKDFRYSLFGRLKSYEALRAEPWFRDLKNSIGHDFDRIPTRQGWKELIRASGLRVEKTMGVDIVLDSFLMYYVFAGIRKAYAKAIRWKSRKLFSGGAGKADFPIGQAPVTTRQAPDPRPAPRIQTYSWKRKAIGFLWRRIFLEAYWLLCLPERLFPERGIGASVYFVIAKPDR